MTTPTELRDIARLLAREAGDLIVDRRRAHVGVSATKSSVVDVVTEVDIAAEELLRRRIAELRPGDGVLGEEQADTESTTGITWVVDPIDGTVNYLYGLPHYSVSVAAVSGTPKPGAWTIEAGAVFEAGAGRMWSAARGEGADVDGVALQRGEAAPLDQTLLGTGFQYVAHRREFQGAMTARMLGTVRDIRRLGSAAIDLSLVAGGHLDAYAEHWLNPWDMAAGALIAAEAGMRVEGLNGAPAGSYLTIAAHPDVFDELHAALVAAGAAEHCD